MARHFGTKSRGVGSRPVTASHAGATMSHNRGITGAHAGEAMRSETIAIHSGYEADPTTHAVAVPIYQTVAYTFDSAEHGAALFNLEAEGFRYSRISNPTVEVLDRRGAAVGGGGEGVCVIPAH